MALTRPLWHSDALQDEQRHQWLPLLMEWALADNADWVPFLRQQARRGGVDLPPWQQLSLALQENDQERLEHLVFSDAALPLADKTQALAQLGYAHLALDFGNSQLSPALPSDVEEQLRRITVSVRPTKPHGIELWSQWNGFSDIALQHSQFRYAHATDDAVVDGRLSQYQYAPGNLLGSGVGGDTRADLGWYWVDDDQRRFVALALDQHAEGVSPGLSLGWEQRENDRWGWGVSATQGARTTFSGAAHALTRWHYLQGQFDWQWDRRTDTRTTLRFNRYDSITGESLGEGVGLDMGLSHRIFLADPTWTLRTGLQYLDNELAPGLPMALTPYYRTGLPAGNPLIPERFGRIGVGSTWQHGEPGELVHALPSPHWKVDLDLGYQWWSKQWDMGTSVGLGWRVLGDDELSLNLSHSSATAGGGGFSQVRLGYSNYF